MKKRIYEVLEKGGEGDWLSKIVDGFLILLILVNVLAVIMETVDDFYQANEVWLDQLEFFSICVFSAEYLLRLWTITENPSYAHPIMGRLKYIFSWNALIDLMAVMPFYLPRFFTMDGRVLRTLRLMRLFRLLKFKRYSSSMKLVNDVLKDKREELIISIVMTLSLLVVASCFMYYLENSAQPEAFSSIPATMWWGVATLTTVGYGDIYPITPLGKILGSCMAILGIGVFALPAGILANGFGEAVRERGEKKITKFDDDV